MNTPPPPPPIATGTGTGKGKLSPHRVFIMQMIEQGAPISEIQEALLRDKSLKVKWQSLQLFIKKQTAKRLVGKALVDLNTAQVLKEAVEIATQLTKGGHAKTITPATTTATETASARPVAPTTSEPALIAPVSEVSKDENIPDRYNPNRTQKFDFEFGKVADKNLFNK